MLPWPGTTDAGRRACNIGPADGRYWTVRHFYGSNGLQELTGSWPWQSRLSILVRAVSRASSLGFDLRWGTRRINLACISRFLFHRQKSRFGATLVGANVHSYQAMPGDV
jgi:hypothetical protein